MSLSLAELTALVQDQIQKSFEYGEQIATIGRDSDHSDLRMKLCEAEVDLPVEFTLDEVGVSPDQIKALIADGNAIDISSELLGLPKVDKKFEFALKDRMTIDTLSKIHAEQADISDQKPAAKRSKTNIDVGLTLPEMITEIHVERAKKLPWEAIKNRKFAQLKVANLTPETTVVESPNKFSGRISLKFKADIK